MKSVKLDYLFFSLLDLAAGTCFAMVALQQSEKISIILFVIAAIGLIITGISNFCRFIRNK